MSNKRSLRSFADILRSLPDRAQTVSDSMELAGSLLLQAIEAGAFGNEEWAAFRCMVRERARQGSSTGPYCRAISAWCEGVAIVRSDKRRPTLNDADQFAEDCELVARTIEQCVNAQTDEQLSGDAKLPIDLSAYRPATEVLREHIPDGEDRITTYKQLTALLAEHREIKTYKPSQQRLSIHVGDWLAFWKSRNAGAKGWSNPTPDELKRRKDAIRRTREGK